VELPGEADLAGVARARELIEQGRQHGACHQLLKPGGV